MRTASVLVLVACLAASTLGCTVLVRIGGPAHALPTPDPGAAELAVRRRALGELVARIADPKHMPSGEVVLRLSLTGGWALADPATLHLTMEDDGRVIRVTDMTVFSSPADYTSLRLSPTGMMRVLESIEPLLPAGRADLDGGAGVSPTDRSARLEVGDAIIFSVDRIGQAEGYTPEQRAWRARFGQLIEHLRDLRWLGEDILEPESGWIPSSMTVLAGSVSPRSGLGPETPFAPWPLDRPVEELSSGTWLDAHGEEKLVLCLSGDQVEPVFTLLSGVNHAYLRVDDGKEWELDVRPHIPGYRRVDDPCRSRPVSTEAIRASARNDPACGGSRDHGRSSRSVRTAGGSHWGLPRPINIGVSATAMMETQGGVRMSTTSSSEESREAVAAWPLESERYVVVKTRNAFPPAPGELALATAAERPFVPAVEVVEATLDREEHADVRRDPSVRAIAAPMPMVLIEPVARGEPGPAAGGVTWGVAATRATESPFDGQGVTVAVLDTGIDADHAAFAGVELVRENFTTEDPQDLHGHGTHCAGTIFGRDVEGTRIGIATGVERALIGKVLGAGGGSSAGISKAVQWAIDGGAHVISMSLGIDFPGFVSWLVRERGLAVEPATSIALQEYRANINLFSALAGHVRATGAFIQGSVLVAAAGNESRRPRYEIAVAPPAAGTGFVAVGAVGEGPAGPRIADFSNTEVNLVGPGVDVVSAAPGGGLTSMSGTSMATPHVAGVAALWAQKLLGETGRVDGDTLKAMLVVSGSTDRLAPGFELDDVGRGMVQAPLV